MRRFAPLVLTLAILSDAGCGGGLGDSADDIGGLGGSPGDASICTTICEPCGEVEMDCRVGCNENLGNTMGLDLESCPAELAVLGECVALNGCQSPVPGCRPQLEAWVFCIATRGAGAP